MTPAQMEMYLTDDNMVDPNSVGYTVGRGGGPPMNSGGNLVFDNLEEAREWQRKHQQA